MKETTAERIKRIDKEIHDFGERTTRDTGNGALLYRATCLACGIERSQQASYCGRDENDWGPRYTRDGRRLTLAEAEQCA